MDFTGNMSWGLESISVRHGQWPIRENDCSYLWSIPSSERCEWIKNNDDCASDSIVQYTTVLFCSFGADNIPFFVFGLILVVIWLFYLFLILGATADNFFCPSLAVLASALRLSENIAGVTILAFGNGAPDIFTSMVSGNDKAIIMFTELIGAGVFVTAVIAGTVALVKPFRPSMLLTARNVCFYIFSVCWIAFVTRDEKVYLWEAISFIFLYILFIVVVVLMQIHEAREGQVKNRIPGVPDTDVLHVFLANRDIGALPKIPMKGRPFSIHAKLNVAIATELDSVASRVTTGEEDELSRPKGLFKELLYIVNPISSEDWVAANKLVKALLIVRAPFMFLLQLFIPVVNTTAEKDGWCKLLNCLQLCVTPTFALFLLNVWNVSFGPIHIIPLSLFLGTTMGAIVFLITENDRVPKFHKLFAIVGFLSAMLTVYLTATEVMAVLRCIGCACSISDAMLGITFLAWGNSVGDLISNVAIARRGFPRMGFAACFGGPMFNTLMGFGLGYGISAASAPNLYTKIRTSDMAPGCLVFLLCSLIATLLYLLITDAIVRRSFGYLLYSIYFSFILIQFLSEFHVIHPLGTDHRPDGE